MASQQKTAACYRSKFSHNFYIQGFHGIVKKSENSLFAVAYLGHTFKLYFSQEKCLKTCPFL